MDWPLAVLLSVIVICVTFLGSVYLRYLLSQNMNIVSVFHMELHTLKINQMTLNNRVQAIEHCIMSDDDDENILRH